MLHAGVTITTGRGSARKPEVLSIPFIKKYIQYAKSRIKPVLTEEASDCIGEIYVALRNNDMEGSQRKTSPMTVRTLETIIRLATAHAKARLSNRVEELDARAAEEILRFALFKEVVEDEKKSKRRKTRPLEDESSGSDSSDSDSDDTPVTGRNGSHSTRGTARTRAIANARNGTRGTNAADDSDDRRRRLYRLAPHHHPAIPHKRHTLHRPLTIPSLLRLFDPRVPSLTHTIPIAIESEDTQEEDAELASGTAALHLAAAPEQAITVPRLAEFRTALGREMSGEAI